MREILRYLYIPKNTVCLNVWGHYHYKDLNAFLQPKRYKREYVILIPFIQLWKWCTYYINNNMYYVESIAEHKKASLPIHEQFDE